MSAFSPSCCSRSRHEAIAALERGTYVALGDAARPTLSASRALRARVDCAPSGCSLRLPPELRGTRRILLELTQRGGRAKRGEPAARQVRRAVLATRGRSVIPLPRRLAPRAAVRAEVRGVLPARDRDATTAEVTVPPGARLRFAVGVEEPAWWIDSAPVDLVVTVLVAEEERELFRRRLDPARAEGDRAWHDADLSLGELAGRRVRFRFAARPVVEDDARPSLPVWGDPTLWAPGRDDARPTVVLVSLDTLRARSTSLHGHAHATTPGLEAIARSGALFANAFTTFSNTLGAHASMLTGLYPKSHGVVALERRLAPDHPTLAEVLRAAGWETAAFTENGLLRGEIFARGFGLYVENEGVFSAAGDAAGTFRRALAWARSRAGTPFFLFVHTYAVHLPYEPPPEYAHLFEDGVPAEERAPVERERLRYEQEVRALDDEVAKLVAGLAAIVPAERLLLVLTSDHGEEFGEHGSVTHLQLYDEVMHVPLVLRWPGRVPAGTRIAAPVSLVDLVPTILDLVAVSAPAVEGRSLAPLLADPAAAPEREAVYAQSLPYEITGDQWRFVARDARTKCILPESAGAGEDGVCFDLAADPGERRPLPVRSDAATEAMYLRAAAYREGALGTIAGAKPLASGAREVDPAAERKLRALGYVE